MVKPSSKQVSRFRVLFTRPLVLTIIFFSPASTKPAGLKIVKLYILLPNKIGTVVDKNYVCGKVLLNATALPRWSDTESLWYYYYYYYYYFFFRPRARSLQA